MASSDNRRFRVIMSPLGKALLEELLSAPWEHPALKSIESISAAIGTHTGSRRSRNEDRSAVAHVITTSGQRFAVAIVCDGVGGSEMGDTAATLAIASFLESLASVKKEIPVEQLITDLVKKTDAAVREELKGRGSTTLSVLLTSANGQTAAANIGDSRVYSWRPGNELAQISIDDTIENELKRLPIQDSSALDFHRLRGGLSQAIGELGRTPDELRINVLGSSYFTKGAILATDGAWKSDDLGFTLVALHATTAADAIRRILSLSAWTGGVDNVSVIAIEDISKFAKQRSYSESLELGTASITAWIYDTKFVAVASRPMQQAVRKMEEADQNACVADPVEKKERRRAQTRHKNKSVETAKAARQLDFTEEIEKAERPIIDRPKIEISTDDDPPHKK